VEGTLLYDFKVRVIYRLGGPYREKTIRPKTKTLRPVNVFIYLFFSRIKLSFVHERKMVLFKITVYFLLTKESRENMSKTRSMPDTRSNESKEKTNLDDYFWLPWPRDSMDIVRSRIFINRIQKRMADSVVITVLSGHTRAWSSFSFIVIQGLIEVSLH
jgi:hypothetical protein